MALTAGVRLGPYAILSALGAGGMGEVYRARDTRLERDVAVKVLPAAFAADPDRLARFEREARVLASVNHPNIATIYGFEQAEHRSVLIARSVSWSQDSQHVYAAVAETETDIVLFGGLIF